MPPWWEIFFFNLGHLLASFFSFVIALCVDRFHNVKEVIFQAFIYLAKFCDRSSCSANPLRPFVFSIETTHSAFSMLAMKFRVTPITKTSLDAAIFFTRYSQPAPWSIFGKVGSLSVHGCKQNESKTGDSLVVKFRGTTSGLVYCMIVYLGGAVINYHGMEIQSS